MLRQMALVMIMLLLASCTASPQVTDAPFNTATPRPIETVTTPEGIGGTAIPLDFSSGNPVVLSDIGSFRIAVSGEFVQQTDAGTVLYNFLPETDSLAARNQLSIATTEGNASAQINFQLSPDIELGQYTLISPADYFAGGVSASYERLVFDGTVTRVQSFSENVAGTLTLTAIGEIVSGRFQFTADFTETSATGEVDVQSIEVTGTFENVPYLITSDDPFELDVPVPTRNFDGETEQP